MRITAKQLAFLLNITKTNANKKIMLALHGNYAQAKMEHEINPDGEIDAELFEKKTGIPVVAAMNDLRENALKRKAFAKYLLRDFPEAAIGVQRPPKLVRLPEGLRSLLSEQVIDEICEFWNKNYYKKMISKWEKSVDYWPEFKP
jgi:hypothetical protein